MVNVYTFGNVRFCAVGKVKVNLAGEHRAAFSAAKVATFHPDQVAYCIFSTHTSHSAHASHAGHAPTGLWSLLKLDRNGYCEKDPSYSGTIQFVRLQIVS